MADPAPYLLAIAPALALYGHNPGGVMPWELLLTLVAVLVPTLLVGMLLQALYGNAERVALATSWTVLLVFAYGFVYEMNAVLAWWNVSLRLRQELVLPVWAVLLLGGMARPTP